MIESLILIESASINVEPLRSLSLSNALQLVVGSVPGTGTVLHVAATTAADLSEALVKFAQVNGVTGVLTLMVRNR
jgi:hypothetical protein